MFLTQIKRNLWVNLVVRRRLTALKFLQMRHSVIPVKKKKKKGFNRVLPRNRPLYISVFHSCKYYLNRSAVKSEGALS